MEHWLKLSSPSDFFVPGEGSFGHTKANFPKSITHFTTLMRKPVGMGAEIKNSACAETGIMLFLEFTRRRRGNENQEIRRHVSDFPHLLVVETVLFHVARLL